jgi:glycosyltransferase involved in cell wall biosynthesis
MRYVWEQQGEYFGEGRASAAVRAVATLATSYLRTWDEAAARRPDHYISNSENIARRVKKRYGIDSEVIYPPVNCSRFALSTESRRNAPYVMLTAFAPYKRVDLAIEAFTKMNKRLVIAGGGQEGAKLKTLVKPGGPVELLGEIENAQVAPLLQSGRAFIFPGEEDFGIAPVEAQACGTPVIAFGRGGALETIVGLGDAAGRTPTGLFFEDQSVEGLIEAVEEFERREGEFSPEAARENAFRFDRPVIKEQLRVSLNREFGQA